MKIDNIVINKTEEKKVKAYVAFVLDDAFAVHDARIIEGNKGLFVAMPSKKTQDGFKDVCHPISKELRKNIEQSIIAEYKKVN